MGVFFLLLVTNSPPRTLSAQRWVNENLRPQYSWVFCGLRLLLDRTIGTLFFFLQIYYWEGWWVSEWASTLLGFALRMKTAPLLLLCLPSSFHHCEVRSANDTAAASMAANAAADEDDDGEKRRSLRLKWKTDLTMLDGISADDGCWNRISRSRRSFCRRRLQLKCVMGHQGRKENMLNIWTFNAFFSMN